MPDTIVSRTSAISGALRALSDLRPGQFNQNGETFRIYIAADHETRRRAYALACRVYRSRGYVDEKTELIVSDFDAEPRTLTLLAEDEHGREAATATMVCDGDNGLPSDEIFGAELSNLRDAGRRLTEITRLAIAEEHQHSRLLLLRLFNMLYIYARRVREADDCVIEINPRHVGFYQRLLLFESLTAERPCPRVAGAPAVLSRLQYVLAEREILRDGSRTLYPQFYRGADEDSATEFLASSHRPMNSAEAHRFGVSRPCTGVVFY